MSDVDLVALVITLAVMGVGGALLYLRSLSRKRAWQPDTTHEIHEVDKLSSRLMVDSPFEGRIYTTPKPGHQENMKDGSPGR
jgi:ABC-type taurine transport system ATPase subunit